MEGTYRHFTLEERRTLFRLLNAKLPINEIAGQLGRHRSTIYREIARNEFREVKQYRGYYPITAEDNARRRRRRQRKLVRDAHLRGHVVEKLKLLWSPEQIAGRLKIADEDGCLCHETIYQFVYSPEGRALELHRHLLRARRLRRQHFGRKPRSPKIPLERTIAQRPAPIGERHAIGHWEADLLIFRRAHGQANVTSLVERKSRLVRLLTNSDRRSAPVIRAIGETLAELPPAARQSITFDRGSEFLGYAELTSSHGVEAYSYGGELRQASTACCLHRGLPWGSGTGLSRPCRTMAGTNSYAVAFGADPDNANVGVRPGRRDPTSARPRIAAL